MGGWERSPQPHNLWRWEGAAPALKVSVKKMPEGAAPFHFSPDSPDSVGTLHDHACVLEAGALERDQPGGRLQNTLGLGRGSRVPSPSKLKALHLGQAGGSVPPVMGTRPAPAWLGSGVGEGRGTPRS